MKFNQALNLYEFVKHRDKTEVPLKVQYKLLKIEKWLEEETNYYHECMNNIIANYGQQNDDGTYKFSDDKQFILIQEGKEKECNNEIAQLNNMEIDCPSVGFTLEELEPMDLTFDELKLLYDLINE